MQEEETGKYPEDTRQKPPERFFMKRNRRIISGGSRLHRQICVMLAVMLLVSSILPSAQIAASEETQLYGADESAVFDGGELFITDSEDESAAYEPAADSWAENVTVEGVTVEDGMAGDAAIADGMTADGMTGTGTDGDGSSGNGTIGDGIAGDGTIGDGISGDSMAGDGMAGDAAARDGLAADSTIENEISGDTAVLDGFLTDLSEDPASGDDTASAEDGFIDGIDTDGAYALSENDDVSGLSEGETGTLLSEDGSNPDSADTYTLLSEDGNSGILSEGFLILEDQGISSDGDLTAEGSDPEADPAADLSEAAETEEVELLLDPEEESEEPEEETEEEEFLDSEDVEGYDPTVVPDDPAPSASSSLRKKLFSAGRSAASFTSFGDQLETGSRYVYDQMADCYLTKGLRGYTADENGISAFVTDDETGARTPVLSFEISYSFEKAKEMGYTFPIVLNEENKLDKTSEEYLTAASAFKYMAQSAIDAFSYDYPELFWYRPDGYTMRYKGQSGTAYLSGLVLKMKESFPGAYDLRETFDAQVTQTMADLLASSDYDEDGEISIYEKIQSVHDYVIERMYYDHEGLATYESTGDYRIFTAAGSFVDSVGSGIVCEGYSKAAKILLNRMGVPCCLIRGSVTGSDLGHMWNAVSVDGSWYLMDVTWDDKGDSAGTEPYYRYYLAPSIANRTSNGRFSKSTVDAQTFAYPSTAAVEDHSFALVTSDASGCTTRPEYRCTHGDGVRYWLSAPGHSWNEEGVCSVCGISRDGSGGQTEPQTEPQSEGQTEPQSEGQTEPQSEGQTEPQSEGQTTEPQSEGQTEPQSEGQTEPQSEGQTEPQSEGQTEPQTEGQTEPQSEGQTEPQTEKQTEKQTESQTERQTEAQTEKQTEKQTQPQTEKQTETENNGTAVSKTIPLTAANVQVKDLTYTGSAQKGIKKVTLGGKVLAEGTDYTVKYSSNVNAGTASYTITGKGSYTGTIKGTFTIRKRSMTSLSVTATDEVYTGKAVKSTVRVLYGKTKLKAGTHYTLSYSKNVKAGKASVTVTGKGNYKGKTTVAFRILPRDITDAKITGMPEQVTYTGKKRKPVPKLTFNGKTLKRGTDYKLSWSSCKAVGRAKLTITGIGNYGGSKTVKYRILPATPSKPTVKANGQNKVKIRWKKAKGAAGYQIQVASDAKFTDSKAYRIKSSAAGSLSVKRPEGAKHVYVRIRAWKKSGGKTYYSAWSKKAKY